MPVETIRFDNDTGEALADTTFSSSLNDLIAVARHPRSFVSLDRPDQMLRDGTDAV